MEEWNTVLDQLFKLFLVFGHFLFVLELLEGHRITSWLDVWIWFFIKLLRDEDSIIKLKVAHTLSRIEEIGSSTTGLFSCLYSFISGNWTWGNKILTSIIEWWEDDESIPKRNKFDYVDINEKTYLVLQNEWMDPFYDLDFCIQESLAGIILDMPLMMLLIQYQRQ